MITFTYEFCLKYLKCYNIIYKCIKVGFQLNINLQGVLQNLLF